jgi:ZIP family zinc transporter
MPILLSLAAFLMTLLGGFVAYHIRKHRHLVLGAAGGVMLGVVAFDLIPRALSLRSAQLGEVPLPMLTFALAFLLIHVVERSMGMHDALEGDYVSHRHSHAGVGLIAGTTLVVHSFLDGAAIGAAYQTDATLAVAVAIGVIAHDFTDGFNTYTITSLYGNARRRAVTLLLLDALAPVAGATVTSLVTIPEGVLGAYLGLFAGFLMYLATSDILPEAHTTNRAAPTLLATAAGTAFMWLVIGFAE